MKNGLGSKKFWGLLALISALVALALHGYLAREYYQIKMGLSVGKSVCNLSATFNCEAVAASTYASLFKIPLALWGFWTNLLFALVLGWSLLGWGNTRRSAGLAFLFSVFILLASVVMGLISVTQLHTYCLFCIGAYVTSVLIFIGTWRWTQQEGGWKTLSHEAMGAPKNVLLTLLAIPALTWFSNRVMLDQYGAGKLDIIVQESINEWKSSPIRELSAEKGLVYQAPGNQAAKVTVVEFVDLLCPHCKSATPTLHAFVEARPDTRLVLKVFPLDGSCNTESGMQKGSGLRCQLAAAVFCADKTNKQGWKALDWVFERQATLFDAAFDPTLESLSKDLSISLDEMKACVTGDEMKKFIVDQASEGVKAQIRGTPSVFLNGKQVSRGQFLPVLDAVYREAQ